MKNKLTLLLSALLLHCSVHTIPIYARTKFQSIAQEGGVRMLVNSNGATNYGSRSCPGATITVKAAGTSTIVSLYSTEAGTVKSNPFTADNTGAYSFYINDGDYDLTFTGGGCTTRTLSDITIGGSSGVSVPVTSFGAVCDGTTDDTVAFQAAVDFAGGHTVTIPAATCKITDQILISQHSITVEGTGMTASVVSFIPTAGGKAAFKAKLTTAGVLNYPTFRNFYIRSSDTTYLKYGIWLVDTTGALIENVQIGTGGTFIGGANVGSFTGSGSTGVYLQGREFTRMRNLNSFAAMPLVIGLNPNFPSIDLDHSKLEDFYLMPTGNNPSIFVTDGANVTNLAVEDGAFVTGGYGVYWNETGGSSSDVITFRNIRAEQFVSAGHIFYIASNTQSIRNLRIEQVLGGTSTNLKGLYLRGMGQETGVVIDGFKYNGTIECINADNTVGSLDWRNSFCQDNSTKSLGTLAEVWAEGFTYSLSPMTQRGLWINPNSAYTAGNIWRFLGVKQWAYTGSLANAATLSIPSGGGVMVTGLVTFTFKGATVNGGLSCVVNSARTIGLATSDATLTSCTNSAGAIAGDITFDWGSVNSMLVRNNTGETVTLSVSYTWN